MTAKMLEMCGTADSDKLPRPLDCLGDGFMLSVPSLAAEYLADERSTTTSADSAIERYTMTVV